MKKFLSEFKAFALRGNVMDLAVGVIIGGAFTALVTSLINNLINPIIGCFSLDGFSGLSVTVGKATLTYGAFIMDVINFIIMAFVVFLLIKAVNKLATIGKKEEKEAEEAAEEEPPKPTTEELLAEILEEIKNK
ncbi:MAG: large conductance mechanosensitive channel protein MscL [Oscillospiraceae bacterium]|nr:large conductance mechanosensitive channel protein MscL [Oscillospiraceae bacterium]